MVYSLHMYTFDPWFLRNKWSNGVYDDVPQHAIRMIPQAMFQSVQAIQAMVGLNAALLDWLRTSFHYI
jgi:hypothetical protein